MFEFMKTVSNLEPAFAVLEKPVWGRGGGWGSFRQGGLGQIALVSGYHLIPSGDPRL